MDIEAIGPSGARPAVQTNGVSELSAAAAARRLERVAAQSCESTAARGGDCVELSDRGRELQRARQAVEDAPDVRADRVAALRQQIADGTYDVSPEQLASKLLGEG